MAARWGCRVPGCNHRRHLHAHHIHNWADGGKTSASNLVLLCTGHHTAVHEGTLSVGVREGKIVFENTYGLRLRPVPARDDEDTQAWLRTAERELDTDRYPSWDGSRLDLDVVLDSIHCAEAWHAHM